MTIEQIYFTMSSLEITSLLIICFILLFVHNTLRVMAKNTQLIYKSCNNIKLKLYYTSVMVTMGTINAKIAPSSDLIQQLPNTIVQLKIVAIYLHMHSLMICTIMSMGYSN